MNSQTYYFGFGFIGRQTGYFVVTESERHKEEYSGLTFTKKLSGELTTDEVYTRSFYRLTVGDIMITTTGEKFRVLEIESTLPSFLI